MLTNQTATARVTREINSCERAVDNALVEMTALAHSIALAARDLSDAPPIETQAALLRTSKAVENLIGLRGETVRLHGQLKNIGRELAAGEEPWCPPKTGELLEPEVALKLA